MELPKYHSPEVETYANAVTAAIGSQRLELASVLQDVPPETTELADELEALSGKWNPVELFTASNFRAERTAFLDARKNGEHYVPTFLYPRAEVFDVAGSCEKLIQLRVRARALPHKSDRDKLARITILAKIDDDLATCDFVEGIQKKDDALVARGLAEKYPALDDELYDVATTIFDEIVSAKEAPRAESKLSDGDRLSDDEQAYLSKERTLSPEEEAEAYRWALREYGMLREGDEGEGFRVVVDEGVTALDVRDKSESGPTVFVPVRDKPYTAMEVCSLIAHEIEGHARQAMNGKLLFKLGGGGLRKDDETLYEGLAIRHEWDYLETYFGKVRYDIDHNTLFIFAVRMANEGKSFEEIFEDQLKRCTALSRSPASSIYGQSDEDNELKAFRMTYRVMRGHTDTSNKEGFAMSKDLAYLRGWLMDQQLIDKKLGHANETAIMSTKGLQSLATMAIEPEDVPIKFKNVAAQYHKILLAERPAKKTE